MGVQEVVTPISVPETHAAAYLLGNNMFIAFNASTEELEISIPDGSWDVHVYGDCAGTTTLFKADHLITIPPISAIVLTK